MAERAQLLSYAGGEVEDEVGGIGEERGDAWVERVGWEREGEELEATDAGVGC